MRGIDRRLINRPHADLGLTGYEGNAFASTGDAAGDLLSITSVHPMREEAVRELLAKTQSNWSVVEELIEHGKLRECPYEGCRFYIRRYSRLA